MRVRAIEARSDRVLFIGTVPIDSLQAESSGAGRMFIRPRGLGKLYTTQGAPTDLTDPVGFLVIHHPVRLTSGQVPEEGEFIWVALEAPRSSVRSATGPIGLACCSNCNEPISEQRLRAVPGVKVCTKCQRLKEKIKNE